MRRRLTDTIQTGSAAMAEFIDAVRVFRKRKQLVLTAARGLLAARCRYPNNREFHRWLRRTPYSAMTKHDRSALTQIGRHEWQVRRFLATTGIASPTLLWRTAR